MTKELEEILSRPLRSSEVVPEKLQATPTPRPDHRIKLTAVQRRAFNEIADAGTKGLGPEIRKAERWLTYQALIKKGLIEIFDGRFYTTEALKAAKEGKS